MRDFRLVQCASSVLVLSIGASCLWAQDWPQWRGPNRDGKAAGFSPPAVWPPQLTQKWKVPVGIGDSTPALVGNRLYTFGRQDAEEAVRCLEANTGKTLWEEKYPAQHVVTGPPARHPGTRSSPAVADGRICTLGVGGILSCLDAASGKVLWRKQSTNEFMNVAYKHDSSMSPLIVDGWCIVFVGGGGQGAVIAFDLATGEPKWKWDGDAPACSSPVVMTVAGVKQLVTLSAKNVIGLRLADGQLLWKLRFEATQGNNTTPVVDGQTVIYTGQGKGLFSARIEPQEGGFTATPLWTNVSFGARFTTPVLKDGRLFGYSGKFFCVDARTGATQWSDATSRGNSGALVDAGAVLLGLTVNSELTVFKPSGEAYSELAKFKVAESETWAHPIVAGGRIYVRDRDNVALWTWE
jgi:outer membrane protein assembly factor BamB